MKSLVRQMFLLAAASFLLTSAGQAQGTASQADRIEEDWQVVIANPDPSVTGPQITTCMSPVTDSSTPFVAFDLNYRDFPSFRAGGVQVKVYSGESVLDSETQGSAICETANETITWTQRMSLSGGTVSYVVVNGQSTTWGQFGQGQGLLGVGFTTSLGSFASYSPDTSVAKSGVSWQSNRVTSMTLLRVRYYSGGNLISTDNTPRTVVLSSSGG